MKVHLVGRVGDHKAGGGIARSLIMIGDGLRAMGDEVVTTSCRARAPVSDTTEVVYYYGDENELPHYLAACRAQGIPLLLNSTYDGTAGRVDALKARMEKYDPSGDVLYLGVFSQQAAVQVAASVTTSVVHVPKTVRVGKGGVRYRRRSGICIGDVAKTFDRPRLVRGLDPVAAVRAIRAAHPDLPIYAYGQYNSATDVPPGVTVRPYGNDNFIGWLGTLRAYVSFAAHETFAMVPAEVQAVGTPVLYRRQPQSLNEHLNSTAFPFGSTEDLVVGLSALLGNVNVWAAYSNAGIANARAHILKAAGAGLHMELRRLCERHKRRTS